MVFADGSDCQNQYYLASAGVSAERLRELFELVLCPSRIARDFLANVFGFTALAVIPPHIESVLFQPAPKTAGVAVFPRKMPQEASLVEAIFR
ncbi:MAG: hypothetical protein ACKO2P_00010, partial [Planctomycetota bacterium]